MTAARLADALPSWLGAYVAHAPRAAAVVAGPDGAVLAANPAFVAWHGPAGGPVDGPPAVAALLALAAHTGAPAHGVLPGRDPAQHDAWDCVAWPATDRCAGGGPAPVVLELTPAGPVARVDAQHRDVAERLLLAALREHRLAADAEAARQTAERDMLARSAELARSNAALAQEMTERAELERARNALRRELAGAEEGERRRLARELHDQFGQHLTGLTLGLAEVRRLLPPDAPAHARLTALQTLAADLTRDARTLALELRPPELDDVGLEEALESYVAGWAARYGVAADVAVTGLDTQVPGELGTTVYRIVQEALTNVARHAAARHASVVIEKPDGEVRLIVEDDGRGFDPAAAAAAARSGPTRRLGLAGMRERVALAGGTLTVESAPGAGTTVYVRLPVGPGAA